MVENLKFDLIKIADIDNNDIEIDELITHIKAPDFPTGGIIYGYDGVSRIKQNNVGIVEILLVNEVTIYTNESNLDLLADKLSK